MDAYSSNDQNTHTEDPQIDLDRNDNCESKSNSKSPTTFNFPRIPSNRYTTVAVLTFVNILNYIDRYVIFAILTNIKDFYQMNDKLSGLLQTTFVISYVIFSLIFGSAGDKLSRKWIIIGGLIIWGIASLIGTFIPQNYSWAFFLTRCVVGAGEAGLSTLGFPLIGDLFTGNLKTTMLSIFLIAIPLGNGIGYLLGSIPQKLLHWQQMLRITPFIVFVGALLSAIFVIDPPRNTDNQDPKNRKTKGNSSANLNNFADYELKNTDGEMTHLFSSTEKNDIIINADNTNDTFIDSEGDILSFDGNDVKILLTKQSSGIARRLRKKISKISLYRKTSQATLAKKNFKNMIVSPLCEVWANLVYLSKIRSFVFTQLAFTLSSFVVSGISVWLQTFLKYASSCRKDDIASVSNEIVSIVFGTACLLGGIFGVFVGGYISSSMRRSGSKSADVLICAFSNLGCAFPLFLALALSFHSLTLTWILFVLGIFVMCFTWTPNSEILLNTITPNHMGFAAAVQIMAIHGFGDSVSPIAIGWISDHTRIDESACGQMRSLYNGLLVGPFFIALSGLFYIISLLYYEKDVESMHSRIVI